MLALIPTFAASAPSPEPSTGDGALVRHLEGFGVRCVYAGDIRDGQDALLDHYGAADAHFDNPFAAVIRGPQT
jgi:hypothetical protein